MHIEVPHRLPADAVRRLPRELVTLLKRKHGDRLSNLQESYGMGTADVSFSVQGLAVAVHVIAMPNLLTVDGDVPWVAQGRVTALVEELAQEVIATLGPPAVAVARQPAPPQPAASVQERGREEEDALDLLDPFGILDAVVEVIDDVCDFLFGEEDDHTVP